MPEGHTPARTASVNQRTPTRYPTDLHGKCFNCLSTAHRVATCKLPPCYLRCKRFQHPAWDCKRRRTVPPSSSGTFGALEGQQRRPVRERILGNRPHAQGDTPSMAGAMPSAAAAVLGRLRVATVGADGGDVGADGRGMTSLRQRVSPPTVTGGRRGPHKRHRTSPRSLLELRQGTVGRPTRRASLSPTR